MLGGNNIMKIVEIVCSPGRTGFYFDDQKAIKQGAENDGFTYIGEPATEGFSSIRQAGESISVMIILEDGQVAYGDCAAVQYSGAGGRDPLFLADDFIPIIEKYIAPKLIGKDVGNFKELAEEIDSMTIEGKHLHTAIRYGVTQAILDAVSKVKKVTMAEVIKEEYNIEDDIARVPIFTQSGDDRYNNADKMIIKGADVLPHALINNVNTKLGKNGEKLKEYIGWLRDRIISLRAKEEDTFIIHIDVYGTIGLAFNNDTDKMASYINALEEVASPFKLRIEGPMDVGNKNEQVKALKDLRQALKNKGSKVHLVADEWCNTLEDIKLFVDEGATDMIQVKTPDLGGINNTVEAILYCKDNGIAAYCGGTCNETERSSQVCVNIAMACGADQCLAKPGMGVDEGYMIVYNEMNRILALVSKRNKINRSIK